MAEIPKRVLLTGASGFIGANLARRLVRDGHELHLLLRPAEARWRIDEMTDDVQHHEVALQERERLAAIVHDIDPHWVFHLATYGAYSSQRDVQTIVSTNYNGTVNLVEACLETGFEAFVSAGSSSEYGYKDHAPIESELAEPNSHYAATKAAATLYCRFIAQSRQRRLSTLRLYSVYGPWEDPTRLLPKLMVCGLNGELPPLVSPTIARDYVYIDDAVEAFILTAKTVVDDPGPVFNVGSGVQTTLSQLVEIVREQFQISAEPQWGSMPDRHWDTDVWVADPTDIRAADRMEADLRARGRAARFCDLADLRRVRAASLRNDTHSAAMSNEREAAVLKNSVSSWAPRSGVPCSNSRSARTSATSGPRSRSPTWSAPSLPRWVIETRPLPTAIGSCCRRATPRWRCTPRWRRRAS